MNAIFCRGHPVVLLHYKTTNNFWFQSNTTIYFYLCLDDTFQSVDDDGQLIKTCGEDKNKNKNILLCLTETRN